MEKYKLEIDLKCKCSITHELPNNKYALIVCSKCYKAFKEWFGNPLKLYKCPFHEENK